MTKTRARLLVICFVGFISVLGLWSAIKHDRTMSEFENRVLASFPSFTLEKLWTGKYTEQLEDYVVDQFVNRDMWVGVKSDLERLSGKTENNNVFFGKQDYLFERFEAPMDMLDKNMNQILRFAERQQAHFDSISLLMVPNAQSIYPEYLPPHAIATDQAQPPLMAFITKQLGGTVNIVSLLQMLTEHKNEQQLYFRTDHHWTMRGAYYGYTAFAESLGISPVPLEGMQHHLLSEAFYGTYYTKANQRSTKPDRLELLDPSLPKYEVCIEGSKGCSPSFYHMEALQERDQYKVFFNGNFPIVNILVDHQEKEKQRSIIVFKDSYANAFIPYLAQHYTHIQMIDLRYFRFQLDRYLVEHPADDILMLYSVTTMAKDDIFKWLN